MRYLQCSASLTQGEKAKRLWLDTRAVWECQFDVDGGMNGR